MTDPASVVVVSAWANPIVIGSVAGAIVLVLGALGSLAVLVIKAFGDMQVTVGKIETAVNSKASVAEGRELALQQKVALLEQHIVDMRSDKELLAQAVATRARVGEPPNSLTALPGTPPVPIPVEVVNQPLTVTSTEPS